MFVLHCEECGKDSETLLVAAEEGKLCGGVWIQKFCLGYLTTLRRKKNSDSAYQSIFRFHWKSKISVLGTANIYPFISFFISELVKALRNTLSVSS